MFERTVEIFPESYLYLTQDTIPGFVFRVVEEPAIDFALSAVFGFHFRWHSAVCGWVLGEGNYAGSEKQVNM